MLEMEPENEASRGQVVKHEDNVQQLIEVLLFYPPFMIAHNERPT